jgi:hypothetical protein
VDDIWVDELRRRLVDFTRCPSCGTALTSSRCDFCGLPLDGPDGLAVADASRTAEEALAERQRLVAVLRAAHPLTHPGSRGVAGPVPAVGPGASPATRVPVPADPAASPAGQVWSGRAGTTRPGPGGAPARPGPLRPVPVGAAPGPTQPAAPRPAATRPARQLDVAALFALAGAGLVAAAALVFAFFVVSDAPAARVLVLLLATGAGLAGTVLLRRRGIGSSAEAVAGLSAALVVVDAWVIALLAQGRVRFAVLAVLLLAAGLGVSAAGRALRLRAWTAAVLVLPLVPLCLAGVVQEPWGLLAGVLAGSLVTLVRGPHRRGVREALGVDPVVEAGLFAVGGAGLLALALPVGMITAWSTTGAPVWPAGTVALTLLLMAGAAFAHARVGYPPGWTATAGLLVVTAGAVSVMVDAGWGTLGLPPLAGAVAWALLLLASRAWPDPPPAEPGSRAVSDPRRHALVAGGWTALVLGSLPGAAWALIGSLALLPLPDRGLPGIGAETLSPHAFDRWGLGASLLAPALAAAVLAATLLVSARLPLTVRRTVAPLLPGPPPVVPGTPVVLTGALPGPSVGAGPAVAVTWVQDAMIVRTGRLLAPAATVLLASTLVGLLQPWAVPLLVAEAVLALVLVEAARRLPAPAVPSGPPAAASGPAGPGPARTNQAAALGSAAAAAAAEPVSATAPGAPVSATAPGAPVSATAPGTPVSATAPGAPVSAPPPAPRWPVPGARTPSALEHRAWSLTLRIAATLQIALLAAMTWTARPALLAGTVVVVALLLRARCLVPAGRRPVVVGLAVGYPAVVLAAELVWRGLDGYAVVGTVAVLLVLLAAAGTAVPRVDRGSWLALLLVAAAPAGLGVAMTASERTLWSAGVGTALLVAEGVLLAVRSRPVPVRLRVGAAALVVPTVSVVLIDAGAVWLPGSAAPVLLPVVAVLVAAVAVAAPGTAERLRLRTGVPSADPCRQALEGTAAGTAGIALLLALARPSTGASTVLVLCAILGAGATVVARRPDRRQAWWVAGVLWLGVVWSALAWSGVGLVEAYTLPPALVALGVGALALRRGGVREPLVGAGTALLVAPSLVLAVLGRAPGARSAALLGVAVLALVVAVLADRPQTRDRLGALTDPLALGALVGGLGGAVRAVHLAAGTPVAGEARNAEVFLVALAWSALGAGVMAVAGRVLADRRPPAVRPWAFVPGLVAGTIGALAAVRPTWTVVWVTWVVELVLLALAVLSVRLAAGAAVRGGDEPATGPSGRPLPVGSPSVLPPGWVLWLAALAWAIGGWSLRELRVEVFALPLGLALTAMGVTAMGVTPAATSPAAPGVPGSPRTPARVWPVGFTGSAATLTPGVLATLGPSMLAIWTDPLTWRAIVVVVLALGFMLVGARQMLRAPLVVGAGALPVAVISVFAGRLGRAVSAGPWLLTLLAAGGLLLVLGIYAERRRTLAAEAGEGTDAEPRVLR